jgi:hypothetical protein
MVLRQVSRGRMVYNGRKSRRICLVLDCLAPNDFTDKTSDLVNTDDVALP